MSKVLLEGQRKLWGDLWTNLGHSKSEGPRQAGEIGRFPQGGVSSWEVRAQASDVSELPRQ
eukprot:8786880-Heterocapsa_arctica.AAC.1